MNQINIDDNNIKLINSKNIQYSSVDYTKNIQ